MSTSGDILPVFIRVLSYVYLWAFNGWLMLCPIHLSHDWQMGSIPLVQSLCDTRNLASCFLAVLLISLISKVFISNKVTRMYVLLVALVRQILYITMTTNQVNVYLIKYNFCSNILKYRYVDS